MPYIPPQVPDINHLHHLSDDLVITPHDVYHPEHAVRTGPIQTCEDEAIVPGFITPGLGQGHGGQPGLVQGHGGQPRLVQGHGNG